MRKITPIKGIELKGTRTFVPGAEYGPALPNVQGIPRGQIYAPGSVYGPTLPGEQDFGSIWVTGLDGFTRNLYGAGIGLYDLGNINSAFSEIVAPMYPGGSTDDNDIQIEIPVPVDMDPVSPDVSVVCHFLIPT